MSEIDLLIGDCSGTGLSDGDIVKLQSINGSYIKNSRIRGGANDGVKLNIDCDNIIVEGCVFGEEGNGDEDIDMFGGGSNLVLYDCIFNGNGIGAKNIGGASSGTRPNIGGLQVSYCTFNDCGVQLTGNYFPSTRENGDYLDIDVKTQAVSIGINTITHNFATVLYDYWVWKIGEDANGSEFNSVVKNTNTFEINMLESGWSITCIRRHNSFRNVIIENNTFNMTYTSGQAKNAITSNGSVAYTINNNIFNLYGQQTAMSMRLPEIIGEINDNEFYSDIVTLDTDSLKGTYFITFTEAMTDAFIGVYPDVNASIINLKRNTFLNGRRALRLDDMKNYNIISNTVTGNNDLNSLQGISDINSNTSNPDKVQDSNIIN